MYKNLNKSLFLRHKNLGLLFSLIYFLIASVSEGFSTKKAEDKNELSVESVKFVLSCDYKLKNMYSSLILLRFI